MATVTSIQRDGPRETAEYTKVCATGDCGCPGGVFAGHAKCACDGCRGVKGDCHHMVKSQKLVVSFTLDDGRAGSVHVAPTAKDAEIQTAIQEWSAKNPKPAPDALVGKTIV